MLSGPQVERLVTMAIVGGTATMGYAALTWLLAAKAGLPAAIASLASYACVSVLSYLGHRHLTFRSRRPHRDTAGSFAAVSMGGYVLALAIPGLLSGALGAPIEVSVLVTCLVVPVFSCLAMTRFVFRPAH